MPERVRSRTARAMPASRPASPMSGRPAISATPSSAAATSALISAACCHLAGHWRLGEDGEAQHRHAETDDEAPEGEAPEHVRDEVTPEVEA